MKTMKSMKTINIAMNDIGEKISPVNKINIFKGSPGDVLFSMLYLLKNYKNRLCVPIHPDVNLNNFDDITISYNCDGNNKNFKLKFPGEEFMDTFRKCMKKDIQFIMLPIFIEFLSCSGSGHLNFMILDKNRKEVERFEPYGNDKFTKKSNEYRHKLMTGFDTAMREWVKSNLKEYSYKTPEESCPNIKFGVQDIEEANLEKNIKSPELKTDPGGFCSIWSVWYGELRLKFPNKSSETLVKHAIELLKKDDHSIRTFIRNYSGFIYKEKRSIIRQLINSKEIYLKSSDLDVLSIYDHEKYIKLVAQKFFDSQFKKKSSPSPSPSASASASPSPSSRGIKKIRLRQKTRRLRRKKQK
jgi:hypothetical protein